MIVRQNAASVTRLMMTKLRKEERSTMGYPEIEALIDSEDFDEVNNIFATAYDDLAEIAKKKPGLKKSREAKKAMKSLELTMDLFRELLALKYELAAKAKSGPKKRA